MRILKLGFILAWLAMCTVHGQSKYRVGLCPGTIEGYHTLAGKVAGLKIPKKDQTKELLDKEDRELLEQNDKRLTDFLTAWTIKEKLNRFQVAIYYPDKKVRFWRASDGGKGLFFNESVSAAAGRGGLSTDAKPGDNQRCFFQDTTVVLDTLRIRLGDFSPETRFTILAGQKTYALPLNTDRTELLLYATMLPDLPTGRYLPVQVSINGQPTPVTLYFLSPDDRAQLVRSLHDWTDNDSLPCAGLPDLLVAHLTQNWGGKLCISPALYQSAQRKVMKTLLQTEKISCAP